MKPRWGVRTLTSTLLHPRMARRRRRVVKWARANGRLVEGYRRAGLAALTVDDLLVIEGWWVYGYSPEDAARWMRWNCLPGTAPGSLLRRRWDRIEAVAAVVEIMRDQAHVDDVASRPVSAGSVTEASLLTGTGTLVEELLGTVPDRSDHLRAARTYMSLVEPSPWSPIGPLTEPGHDAWWAAIRSGIDHVGAAACAWAQVPPQVVTALAHAGVRQIVPRWMFARDVLGLGAVRYAELAEHGYGRLGWKAPNLPPDVVFPGLSEMWARPTRPERDLSRARAQGFLPHK